MTPRDDLLVAAGPSAISALADEAVSHGTVPWADSGSRRYGRPLRRVFDKRNTVLAGDTLRDVQAGLHGGARVIAVATGTDSADGGCSLAPEAGFLDGRGDLPHALEAPEQLL